MILTERTQSRLGLRSRVVLEDGRIARVVGTWSFTGARGPSTVVITRRDDEGADPKLAEGASGYLLQPIDGSERIRACWADEDLGTIRPVVGGHLRLVK